MSNRKKVLEGVVDARLTEEVMTCEQWHGFMPRKRTKDSMLAFRILKKNYG